MCLSVYLPDLESQCAYKVYRSFLTISIEAQSRAALKIDEFDQLFVVRAAFFTGFFVHADPLLDFLVRDEPLVRISLSSMNP